MHGVPNISRFATAASPHPPSLFAQLLIRRFFRAEFAAAKAGAAFVGVAGRQPQRRAGPCTASIALERRSRFAIGKTTVCSHDRQRSEFWPLRSLCFILRQLIMTSADALVKKRAKIRPGMNFKQKARISRSDARAIRNALDQRAEGCDKA
ncbi:MAG TPA: hypothetical protein VMB85_22920 [Bryobacteraceae bacterium]|nr:hypothetical protein [Bryobacteraceae bacterium]